MKGIKNTFITPKEYLKEMLDARLCFEIHEFANGNMSCVGLRWGESKLARMLGFKRNDVIKALDYAETYWQEVKDLFN